MSMNRLATWLGFIAAGLIALQFSVDSDTWWHLAAGRWMVEHGQLLRADVFSQTMSGHDWINPGWLAQLALYGVYRLAGLPGLNVWTAAMALVGLSFVWRVMEGSGLLKAFVLVAAASAAAVFWSARPQMVTFTLAALFVWVLERWRRGEADRLWILPLASLLWVNSHGGFAVGPLLIGTYIAGAWIGTALEALKAPTVGMSDLARRAWSASRELLMFGGLSILALMANPQGPEILVYPLRTVSIDVLQAYIQEWQSPDFHSPQMLPFAFLLLATMGSLALSRRRKSPTELLLVFGFAYLSLTAARNISLFAVVAAPSLSRHGYEALEPIASRIPLGPELSQEFARRLNAALSVFVVVAAVLWASPKLQVDENAAQAASRFPETAINVLERDHPPGPILNTYRWGGYLIWRLYPDYKSFVDGRTDLFGDALLQEYLKVWTAGEGWREVIADRGFRLALLEAEAPVVAALRLEGWKTLVEDEAAVLLQAPR